MLQKHGEGEKKNRRPPHAVESAFMGRDILKQSLMPLLQEHFNADMNSLGISLCCCHGSSSASFHLGKGDDLPSNKTPSQAQAIISKSWDSLAVFSQTPKSQSEKRVYPANHCALEMFSESDQMSICTYLLVVRALRLCDQRFS